MAHTAINSENYQSHLLLKLRMKFIAINMAMAFIVLATTFGIVSYLDYTARVNNIYTELNYVLGEASKPKSDQLKETQELSIPSRTSDQSSTLPPVENTVRGQGEWDSTNTSIPSSSENASGNSSDNSNQGIAQIIGVTTRQSTDNSSIFISTYELTQRGASTILSTYSNATIPDRVLILANSKVLVSPENRGYLSEYDLYFMRRTSTENPEHYLVSYADGSTVNGWKALALMLMGGGLAALLVFFVVNIYFSRWALKPIAQSIKQQQQFTADASHELKTPLTVIIANMEILRSHRDETVGEKLQWIDSTTSEAERMQLLVNDMLSLSRPNASKQPRANERIDFSDLVEGEALQFESVAFELGVEIECEIEEGLSVKGDPERLGRMVAILVDNACKYAGENGVVTITMKRLSKITRHGHVLELKVNNTGAPIPPEDLPNIFTRFYRADKARTSSKGSYGLGLAIGQEIAGEHHGVISVESTVEAGTTFTVTLPVVSSSESEN